MKSSLLKIALCAGLISSLTLPANADTCSYKNRGTGHTADRLLKSFKMYSVDADAETAPSITVDQKGTYNSPIYFDKTSDDVVFKFAQGDEIQLDPTWDGAWMHGYLYIDYDNDGSYNIDETNPYGENDGELVSFSGWSPDTGNNAVYKNSLDVTVEAGAGVLKETIPTFKLPPSLAPGKYKAEFKIDWNSKEPCGNSASDNLITNNGGCVVEFYIEVMAPTVAIQSQTITLDDEEDPTQVTISANADGEYLGGGTIKVTYSLNEGEETELPLVSGTKYEKVIQFTELEADTYEVCVKAEVIRADTVATSAESDNIGNFTVPVQPTVEIREASITTDREHYPTQATITAEVAVENQGTRTIKVTYSLNDEKEVEMEPAEENTYASFISFEGLETDEYEVVVKAYVLKDTKVIVSDEAEAGSFTVSDVPTIEIGDVAVVLDSEDNPTQATITVTGVTGELLDEVDVVVSHKLDDGEYADMTYVEDGDKYEVIIPFKGLAAGTHTVSVKAEASKDDCELACHEMEKAASFVVPASETTSLESISMENIDENTRFYNLQGVQVKNPSNGVYIMVNGDKATKVLIK